VLNGLSTTPWSYMGEWRYTAPPFLTSALDGDEWSAPRRNWFTSWVNKTGTSWIGGWMGSGGRESNPGRPAGHYTDSSECWYMSSHSFTRQTRNRYGLSGAPLPLGSAWLRSAPCWDSGDEKSDPVKWRWCGSVWQANIHSFPAVVVKLLTVIMINIIIIISSFIYIKGSNSSDSVKAARGSVGGWGTTPQAGRWRFRWIFQLT
jgi:hypothetical protein